MRIKTSLMILLFALVMASCLKYIDLCISEKYETQLEGLSSTKKQAKEGEEKKKEIDVNKIIAISIIVLSLVAIYPVSQIKK